MSIQYEKIDFIFARNSRLHKSMDVSILKRKLCEKGYNLALDVFNLS